MNIHCLKYILLPIFVVFFACAAEHETTNIYKKIQPMNLASLTWEEEDWPNESFYGYLNRCFQYQVHLQEFKKRHIVFKLFDSLSIDQSACHNCLYDASTMQDLNLLTGKKAGEPYIGQIIDRTHTQLGKVFLYGLMSNPIDDIDQLKRRQDIIKLLVDQQKLYARLDTILQQLAASENLLLSLWAQDGFLQTTKRRYFNIPVLKSINEGCNKSIPLLQAKSMWDHYERTMFLLSGLVAAILLPTHSFSKITGVSLPDYLNRAAERLQGSGGRLLALIAGISNNNVFTAWISLTAGALCALGLKEEYEWARDNVVLDELLQQKMSHIANFLKHIPLLAEVIRSNPELLRVCPAAQAIDTFMHTECLVPDMQRLLALCRSKTLNSKPSIFSVQARVLVAFKLMYDLKSKIEPLLMAIGELDAYLSCAHLYKEFQGKPVQFCFTNYKVDSNPSIAMTDFWNPFIDPCKVVANTLDLHGLAHRNMIITGPNAGGKSTLIKAIPINLILSQSIGLTAASSAEITPFYTIATYLNIVDDIAAGNSLFKAQVLRAQEMINLVDQTPQEKFSFVALDEMFNGTSAKESMAAAYSVVKHIGNFHNNISIIATHFPLLTKLANEEASFENYRVSVEIDDKQGIHYPFKLERGASNQHIALDILKQEGYDYGIIEEATEILRTVNI